MIRNSQFAICLLSLVLVVTGYFGPWVDHKTAALTVTGFELAEFAKFFPQVQGGVVSIARELFYFPLVTVFILLGLLASRSTVRAARLIVPLFAAALLLGMLLPYSIVNSARQALTAHSPFVLDPQYTGQLALVVAGMVLTLLTPMARRFPERAWGILVALLALAGAIPALWEFALLRPLVVALYDGKEPLGPGWGLIACAAGFALLLLSGILNITWTLANLD
ncbi:unnamed protein product [marine sediment metagenome]|uniref:Uncharacterized protein n=1 Tax=marine sediment metagenome TaxID=412755 RepID=X0YUU1_9ZZZZ